MNRERGEGVKWLRACLVVGGILVAAALFQACGPDTKAASKAVETVETGKDTSAKEEAPQSSPSSPSPKPAQSKPAQAAASPAGAALNLLALPIPIGGEAKQIKIPMHDAEGKLKMQFEAQVATRIEEKVMTLEKLRVDIYDETGKPDLQIDMPNSKFNLETQVLTSEVPVVIQRNDFRIEGETMSFDSRDKKGKLVGKVKMVIFNRNKMR